MSEMPAIVVSTVDSEKLYALLDRLSEETEVVRGLFDELDRASVVAPENVPDTVVRMNSSVLFRNEDTGKKHTMELVWPHEADASANKVSILSPAGAALLGLSVGDSISWPLANGKTLHLRLIEVN